MKQVSTIFLVKDPPLERLVALVEYLRSVSDEFIIVIDDRTSDADVNIIKSWPDVKHVMYRWEGSFSAARNAALPLVTRPWTLCVDWDEVPSFEMMKHIKTVTDPGSTSPELAWIYWTPNWWGGVKGEDMPYHWHIRLWRSGHGLFYRPVHELVQLDGQEESATRGTAAAFAPREALLIHSKARERLEEDQAFYERIGERSF